MVTSRSDFPTTLPFYRASYCFVCRAGGVMPIEETGVRKYRCTKGCIAERYLTWDPKLRQYFNERNELVHASVGVIVQREDGAVLLFMRNKFPFAWTLPAGHLEVGENQKQAALRELKEETNINASDAILLYENEIRGDACVGGADIHEWHLYSVRVPINTQPIIEAEEGSVYQWASSDQLPQPLTLPSEFLLMNDKVRKMLLSAK